MIFAGRRAPAGVMLRRRRSEMLERIKLQHAQHLTFGFPVSVNYHMYQL
jgi:hypothetical protein